MIGFMVQTLSAVVVCVSRDFAHRFTKPSCEAITLLEGLGVAGDAHLGVTVQHRSRMVADPTQPNLRQVHLIHSELFAEVAAAGLLTPTENRAINARRVLGRIQVVVATLV